MCSGLTADPNSDLSTHIRWQTSNSISTTHTFLATADTYHMSTDTDIDTNTLKGSWREKKSMILNEKTKEVFKNTKVLIN